VPSLQQSKSGKNERLSSLNHRQGTLSNLNQGLVEPEIRNWKPEPHFIAQKRLNITPV